MIRDVHVVRPRLGQVVLELTGEHDLETKAPLSRALASLISENDVVVVDLAEPSSSTRRCSITSQPLTASPKTEAHSFASKSARPRSSRRHLNSAACWTISTSCLTAHKHFDPFEHGESRRKDGLRALPA